MPLFDERFINYGYNKIEWIETLRYTGYKFAVLINGFGMDVPHPSYVHFFFFIYWSRSGFKKYYKQSNEHVVKMYNAYNVFYINYSSNL